MELLRPVDPDLCKRRATERRRDELNTVFIQKLQPGLNFFCHLLQKAGAFKIGIKMYRNLYFFVHLIQK